MHNIAQLEREIFSDPWSLSSLLSTQEQIHGHIIEYKVREELIGYLIFYHMGEDLELARVAVSPSHRGQGIASKLMQRMEHYAQQNSCTRIILEVRISNEEAIQLYKKQNYHTLGVRKHYYTNPIEDAQIMSRQIQPIPLPVKPGE